MNLSIKPHIMEISKIKLNDANPRTIRDANFDKLCESIKQFPKMMALRPIVVDGNGVVLGGNMRFRALLKLGFKQIPDEWVRVADELTPDEQRRFIIEDNVSFGDWNWETLANEWDAAELLSWGLDIPQFSNVDISVVDESNDSVNFIIKCADIDELEKLKSKLGVNSKTMKCDEFIQKIGL